MSTQSASTPITEYTLPPDKMAKATALYHTGLVIFVSETIFGFVLLLAILYLRVAPRYRDIAERVSRNSFVQALVFVPLFVLTIDIISLPLAMYRHHLGLAYGLSVQGWASWFADHGKAELITLLVEIVAVWFLFFVIRRSPQRWWFYFWLVSIPFIVFVVFIAPVVIDPIFNKFEPLEKTQPQLVEPLQAVAHRGGLFLPNSRMFEMKASEKFTTYNAYVTGLGATKRIVVWDNTAKDMTIGETQFIFGHELGHYVLKHIPKGLTFAIAMMFVGFWLARKVTLAFVARWGARWGVRELGDYSAFPVLLLVLSIFSFVASPIDSAFSRHLEHDADIHGLEVIHGIVPNSPQVAADAFQKLGEKSLDYPHPNPIYVFWTYSHPDTASRLQFALHYRPWDEGKPNKFVK
ncbi:MAG TPA: M48 family metallopeptidase [Candidatus Acidoferrales bacterium]|nr:M48 family metallopeptidase [Candidatus Acidoferrales bacterium]